MWWQLYLASQNLYGGHALGQLCEYLVLCCSMSSKWRLVGLECMLCSVWCRHTNPYLYQPCTG